MENCGTALKAFLRVAYRSMISDPYADIEEKNELSPIVDKLIPVSDFHDVLGRIYPTEAKDPITALTALAEAKEKSAQTKSGPMPYNHCKKSAIVQQQQQQQKGNMSQDKPPKSFVVRMKKHEEERKSRIERDAISSAQLRGLYWKHRKPANVSVVVKKMNAPTLFDQLLTENQILRTSRHKIDEVPYNNQEPIVRYKTVDESDLTEPHGIAT